MNVKKDEAQNHSDKTNSEAHKELRKLNEKTISQLCFKFRNVHYIAKKGRPFTDYSELCCLNKAQ